MLGIWVNVKLKTIAQEIPTFIKDSKSLKDKGTCMIMPPGCATIMVDAKSMYTSIKTVPTLNKIT
eukprot:7447273-Ditylum_brightwellii.AAC.2